MDLVAPRNLMVPHPQKLSRLEQLRFVASTDRRVTMLVPRRRRLVIGRLKEAGSPRNGKPAT
jgi:hypothetical protein